MDPSAKRPDKRPPLFSVEWLGDAAADVRKEWVIPGVLGISEVMVIHSDTKVGKTQLAAQISFAVSTGGEIFGRPVARGAVLYGAFEKPRVAKKRFRGLQRLNGGIKPPIAVSSGAINLANPNDADQIIAAAKRMSSRMRVRLIVVDTLNRVSGGIDENAAGPMGQVFNEITRIAEEVGAAVIVLHHNANGRKGKMRGSSAVPASADVLMSLEVISADVREAKITAANDVPEGQRFRYRLEQIELAPASDDRDAEYTVVMQPIGNVAVGGQKISEEVPVAVRKRAASLLALFDSLNADGRLGRAALLSAARDKRLVSSENLKSGSEQLRLALKELKRQGRIDFTDDEVWSLPLITSNHSTSPLRGEEIGPMGVDQ
jgi:hypothetical protein